MSTTALPSQSEDSPAWYGEVVRRAGLAENSSVRGAMVIKPYGYAIWEAIQRELDDRIKATGQRRRGPKAPTTRGRATSSSTTASSSATGSTPPGIRTAFA